MWRQVTTRRLHDSRALWLPRYRPGARVSSYASVLNSDDEPRGQRRKESGESEWVTNVVTDAIEDPNVSWLQKSQPSQQQQNSEVPRWMATRTQIDLPSSSSSSDVKYHENDQLNALLGLLMSSEVDKGSYKMKFTPGYVSAVDVRDRCSWCDFMVIVEASDKLQLRHLTRSAYHVLKQQLHKSDGESGLKVLDTMRMGELVIQDGEDEEWQVIDLGWCVLHFMTAEARHGYDLETLWTQDET